MTKQAMLRVLIFGILAGLGLSGCGVALGSPAATASQTGVCQVVERGRALPVEIRETSGLARSRRDPGVFWTHNDSGNDPDLFALDSRGGIVARMRVPGITPGDWEDIEAGPCESGTCLYLGDTGDNFRTRNFVTIYRIPEPTPGGPPAEPAVALRARFPDGAEDAESLFVLPSGEIYLVTKGRHGPVALFRYPAPQRPEQTVTLERIRQLGPRPSQERDRVTAATATPDGRWVGIRTYRSLHLYRASDLVGPGVAEPITVDLRPLGELQGEGLAIADDGTVWLSSEAEQRQDRPSWSEMSCALPSLDS